MFSLGNFFRGGSAPAQEEFDPYISEYDEVRELVAKTATPNAPVEQGVNQAMLDQMMGQKAALPIINNVNEITPELYGVDAVSAPVSNNAQAAYNKGVGTAKQQPNQYKVDMSPGYESINNYSRAAMAEEKLPTSYYYGADEFNNPKAPTNKRKRGLTRAEQEAKKKELGILSAGSIMDYFNNILSPSNKNNGQLAPRMRANR